MRAGVHLGALLFAPNTNTCLGAELRRNAGPSLEVTTSGNIQVHNSLTSKHSLTNGGGRYEAEERESDDSGASELG